MCQRILAAIVLGLTGATPVSATSVNQTFIIESVAFTDLYSATLQGPLLPCDPVTPECTFFGGIPPPPTTGQYAVTHLGPGSGSLEVLYDDSTGEILRVDRLLINLPDMIIVIGGAG